MHDLLAWLTALIAAVLPGFGTSPEPRYSGYVEADYVYVAPPDSGRIATLAVSEGDTIGRGDLLYTLESGRHAAALRAAKAREAAARAEWRNLETGSRAAEIAVIRASLARAETDRELARTTLERTTRLHERGVVAQAAVDADRASLQSANARVAELRAQLNVAELPARDRERLAARARLDAARAEADRVRAELADRTVTAPVGGRVDSVYFRAGEIASAGTPVIALLPPDDRVARFFIPEPDRAEFAIGDEFALTCSGCPDGLTARLTFMASEPQHTPPVIYSEDERSRLVFMAEADISQGSGLLPGQPVTLTVRP